MSYHETPPEEPKALARGQASHSQEMQDTPALTRSRSVPALQANRYSLQAESDDCIPRPPTEQRVSNPEMFSPSPLVPSFTYNSGTPARALPRSGRISILRPNFRRRMSHSDDGLSSSPDSSSRPSSSLSDWVARYAPEGQRLRRHSDSSSNSDLDSEGAGVSTSGHSTTGSIKTATYSPYHEKSPSSLSFLQPEASSRDRSESRSPGAFGEDVEELSMKRKAETFVIYPPPDDKPEIPAPSFTTDDLTSIQTKFSTGGCLLSVHEPTEAVAWTEANWDTPDLTSIRDKGCGGPLAWMLSPTEPALVMFGSYTDPIVVNMAHTLAHSSRFPVVLRPATDDPALTLLAHNATPNDEYVSHVNTGGSSRETTHDSSENLEEEDIIEEERIPEPNGNEGPDENAVIIVEDRQSNGTNSGARDGDGGGGPTGPAINGKWESPVHSITVKLCLKPSRETVRPCVVTINSKLKFAIDPDTEIPIDRADLTRPVSQSEVIALIDHKIENIPRETEIDRSYASIGFLAHRENSIHGREFLYRGFDSPQQIHKHGKQQQSLGGAQGSLGFSHGGPSAKVGLSKNWSNGTTLEATDSKPLPRCHVDHEPGEEWDRNAKSYQSYDVAYQLQEMPLNGPSKAHPVEVKVGMGINLRPPRGSERSYPTMSFIKRDQVLIWVKNPDSKSQIHGTVVSMSNYVDDITTKEKLSVYEEVEIELATQNAMETKTDEKQAGTISISAARVQKGGSNTLRGMFTAKNRSRPSTTPVVDIPSHECLARGWDTERNTWRGVRWPALDKEFAAAGYGNTACVWQIQSPWNVNVPMAT